jgi:hypothetical protein
MIAGKVRGSGTGVMVVMKMPSVKSVNWARNASWPRRSSSSLAAFVVRVAPDIEFSNDFGDAGRDLKRVAVAAWKHAWFATRIRAKAPTNHQDGLLSGRRLG